jgi:hypothetical protein
MIHHFFIALLLAILLVPKDLPDLNEINRRLMKEYKTQPTYVLKLEKHRYELNYDERAIIDPRWIDEVELYTKKEMPAIYAGTYQPPLVLISLKSRKVDDLKRVLNRRDVQL